MAATPSIVKKLVVVGDDGCGKSALLDVHAASATPVESSPFEYLVADFVVDGRPVRLNMWDMVSDADNDCWYPARYLAADVILVCFAVDAPASLAAVAARWMPKLVYHCARVPIVLVATKVDRRFELGEPAGSTLKSVGTLEGRAMAKRIKARTYLECSVKSERGVPDVFEAAVRAALSGPKGFGRCELL